MAIAVRRSKGQPRTRFNRNEKGLSLAAEARINTLMRPPAHGCNRLEDLRPDRRWAMGARRARLREGSAVTPAATRVNIRVIRVIRGLIPLGLLVSASLVVAATNDPTVHMLVPGFTVQELPVRLANVNNLRFAPDGRLTALGYDGRIWLLKDTDGDGLEDTAEVFWDKPTLSVPVGMAWSTHGLYVSSHGKVSLIRDTDHDGKGDIEEIIASGWPPTDVGSGGADATAVTLDKEGNVYFGLLVADYSNAYRLRKRKDLKPEEREWLENREKATTAAPSPLRGERAGVRGETASSEADGELVSLYDLESPRGTIQKWDPRTKKLETIATGIRVPYALAFNKASDLFNTDQEGETWMPNGNPLDELNHIIPGRNYGFPPRHEKWLPNLISEPPVVAFGPQHQSACGLVFNEPRAALNSQFTIHNSKFPLPSGPAQGLFGPKWWEGDAFVAGESRGKIWRVRLVKTPHGYVGKEHLIARLSMLTTDLAISPRGDLYVSCHSGPPDWGTGPQGEGKIFKITYADPKAPQPVGAWAHGLTEVHVAFDRPLDLSVTKLVNAMRLEFGEHVRAADRFEVLKPPYKAVQQQDTIPRGQLRVLKARVLPDRCTLALTTDPQPQPRTFAVTIAGMRALYSKAAPATVDLDYDLHSTLAFAMGERFYNETFGHLPGLDPELALRLLTPSEEAKRLERSFFGPADSLIMHSKLAPSQSPLSLRFQGNVDFFVEFGTNKVRSAPSGFGTWVMEITNRAFTGPEPMFTFIDLSRRIRPSVLATYRTEDDPTYRLLPREWLLPRWAPTESAVTEPAVAPLDHTWPGGVDLTGADYERGRDLFFGEWLKCATCHRLRGEGATVGPDLSNLVSRDAASVLRDIKEPSAAINPDYVAYNVALRDGEELTGFIRAQEADGLRLITADAKEHAVRRADVSEMRPSGVSLMPTGLLDVLKEGQVRDLLTFLLHAPPERYRAEVERILEATGQRQLPIANRQLNLVLVASKQDHGPGQHDYPAWQKKWGRLLAAADTNVTATSAWERPTVEQFANADALLFYCWNHDWNADRLRQLDDFLGRGGGVVLFHSATIADKEPEQLAERIGLAAQPGRTGYLHTPLDLKLVAPTNHPITRGLPQTIHFLDEPYGPMIGDTNKVEVLATTDLEGQPRPMVWTFQKGRGRVFACILGHYAWTFDDPLLRVFALRGVAWAAGEENVSRFDKLTTVKMSLK